MYVGVAGTDEMHIPEGTPLRRFFLVSWSTLLLLTATLSAQAQQAVPPDRMHQNLFSEAS